ncbi:hypothetical protein [Endozoicomonas ascidiicola]|uniref:hypothetical protein n=1 Tax=Endozoicomonas ascidiicola TaxID=1698521 RepID=UPI000835FE0F|nr:hypothetical protein [Endozoicomonas ascidiicola]
MLSPLPTKFQHTPYAVLEDDTKSLPPPTTQNRVGGITTFNQHTVQLPQQEQKLFQAFKHCREHLGKKNKVIGLDQRDTVVIKQLTHCFYGDESSYKTNRKLKSIAGCSTPGLIYAGITMGIGVACAPFTGGISLPLAGTAAAIGLASAVHGAAKGAVVGGRCCHDRKWFQSLVGAENTMLFLKTHPKAEQIEQLRKIADDLQNKLLPDNFKKTFANIRKDLGLSKYNIKNKIMFKKDSTHLAAELKLASRVIDIYFQHALYRHLNPKQNSDLPMLLTGEHSRSPSLQSTTSSNNPFLSDFIP